MSIPNARRSFALFLVATIALAACSGPASTLAPSGGPAAAAAPTKAPSKAPSAAPSAGRSAAPTASPTAAATAAPGPMSLATAQQSGTVVLPSGMSVSLGSLTVANSLGSVAVGSNGSFALTAFSDGPQFVAVEDHNGSILLMGFLGQGATTVDVNSTALVLAYFATASFSLTDDLRAEILALLPSAPGIGSVAAAIGGALAASPDSLATSNAAVAAQLQTFVTSLIQNGSSSSASGRRLHAIFAGDLAGEAFARRREGVTINPLAPTTTTPGLTPIIDYPSGFHFINTLRRPADLYVDRVSYVDANGNTQPDPGSLTQNGPISIPGTVGVQSGLVSTIIKIINGSYAYSPITTASTQLPLVAGSESTTYQLTTVGPGVLEGAFGQVTSAEQQDEIDLSVRFLVRQFALPILLSLIFPLVDVNALINSLVGSAAENGVVTAVEGDAQITAEASTGATGSALTTVLNLLGNSGNPIVVAMVGYVNQILASQLVTTVTALKAKAAAVFKGLLVVNGILAAFDASAVGKQLAASNRADLWTVKVTPDKVTLTPGTSHVKEGFEETLRAAVPSAGGSGQAFAYTWSNTAMFGHLYDGNPQHVDNFTSSSAVVTYVAGIEGLGTDTIGVSVAAIDGQARNLVGTQSATVQVIPSPAPTPIPVTITISPPGCINFGTSGGSQVYTAGVSATPPPGITYKYLWSFGTDAGQAPSDTQFSDPGSVENGQGYLGTSDTGTLTVGQVTGGGEANVSLTVELEEFNAQNQGVGPPQVTSDTAFFSYGILQCENSQQQRSRSSR